MCGRFSLTQTEQWLEKRFQIAFYSRDLIARYNITPYQTAAVVIRAGGVSVGRKMQWGLIPSWAKDASIGGKMINARAETIWEKPAFRHSIIRRRCLIPSDGYYEWKVSGKLKIPYRMAFPDDRVFCMAGIYDQWQLPGRDPLFSFAIITMPAHPSISEIHDRMPVILSPELEMIWLNEHANRQELSELLHSGSSHQLAPYRIRPLLNKAGYDQPDIWQAWVDEPQQGLLFD